MKNYLFAPFNNDKDKIKAFEEIKSLLIIQKGNIVRINELQAEIEKLNTECWCGCNDDLKAEYMELKAENKRLKNGFGHGVLVELEELDKLKERVKICKENHIRYDIQAIDENTELKADNVQLIDDNNSFHSLFDEVEELKVENERLIDKLQAVNERSN